MQSLIGEPLIIYAETTFFSVAVVNEEPLDLLLRELETFLSLNRPGRVGRHAASRPTCTSKENQNTEKVVITATVSIALRITPIINLRASSKLGSNPTERDHRIHNILRSEARDALIHIQSTVIAFRDRVLQDTEKEDTRNGDLLGGRKA